MVTYSFKERPTSCLHPQETVLTAEDDRFHVTDVSQHVASDEEFNDCINADY